MFTTGDPAPYVAPPAPTLGTQITPLAFTERIGLVAMTAIYAAAPSAPQMQVWIAQTWGARYIDLTDARITAGLNALVAASILTEAQVTTILTAPVQQIELPT